MSVPVGSARITPYLVYEDEVVAIDWLEKAFGFETKVRVDGSDGSIVHVELKYAGGVIGLGKPTDRARTPRDMDGCYTQSLYVFVDDIDAHYARAKAAGAKIFRELEQQDYGDKVYGCEDPGGHLWFFGQRVDQEAWDAASAGGGD